MDRARSTPIQSGSTGVLQFVDREFSVADGTGYGCSHGGAIIVPPGEQGFTERFATGWFIVAVTFEIPSNDDPVPRTAAAMNKVTGCSIGVVTRHAALAAWRAVPLHMQRDRGGAAVRRGQGRWQLARHAVPPPGPEADDVALGSHQRAGTGSPSRRGAAGTGGTEEGAGMAVTGICRGS
jgi:hypothetical protein